MSRRFLTMPLAILLVAGCQTTASENTAAEPSSTAGTETAQAAGTGQEVAMATPQSAGAGAAAEPAWVPVLTSGELRCTSGAGNFSLWAGPDGALESKFSVGPRMTGSWQVEGPNAWSRELSGRASSGEVRTIRREVQPVRLNDDGSITLGGSTCRPTSAAASGQVQMAQAAAGPVTYRGDWVFKGRPYPFEIIVDGDAATYTDLGVQGKSWQASSVTRRGDDIRMEIEDYKFQGYPYGDIGLTVVDAGPDGSCASVDWHGAAAFTRQAEFTAECD